MDPKRLAAAATAAATPGSASDTSDGEVGPARHSQSRSDSPSATHPRSRSNSPSPNLRHSAAALSTSAGPSSTAASGSTNDAGAGGRAPSPRPTSGSGERSPRDHLDSDADADADAGGRVPSPRPRAERSPRSHSHPDGDAADRLPSPRRTPRLTDFNNSAAVAVSEDDGASAGDASPLPRARTSSRIKAADIRPISTRPMDVRRESSQRRHAPRERHSPEYHKRPTRVWSPEDEITILGALIEYRAKKGRLPSSIRDTRKLHSQISGKLSADTSTTETQLSDKIRRLKHKFKLLVTRAKHGRVPDLPTEHDRHVYELSKEVWEFRKNRKGGPRPYEVTLDAESHEEQDTEDSDEDMENGGRRRERTSKKPKTARFENGEGKTNATAGRASHDDASVRDDADKGKQTYPYLWEAVEELCKEHPSGPVFRKAFGVLEKSKAIAMEEKLRNFKMSVIRQQLRRADLVKESVGKVLDAVEGAY
ncbi:hypothetical protein U9M48_038604 [Paspalum notatum var. saurae]|uniref:Glabrous enhancer-binding protein-like DBD domain-containing protein n=1 Tax=Paspalum notatum var. saurae TaxID=547442 RepID=A0AAQ3UH69_PASNO